MEFTFESGPDWVLARAADGREVRLGADWFGIGLTILGDEHSFLAALVIDPLSSDYPVEIDAEVRDLGLAALPGLLARFGIEDEREALAAMLTGHQRIQVAAERRRYLAETT